MTLVVAVADVRQILMLADRKVTKAGVEEEPTTKVNALVLDDARLAVGFTGFARWGGRETSRWLLEAQMEAARGDRRLPPTFDRLTTGLTGAVGRFNLSAKSRRLSILAVGYRYDLAGPHLEAHLVSNFEDWDRQDPEAAPSFRHHALVSAPDEGPISHLEAVIGHHAGLVERDISDLHSMLKGQAPSRALESKVAQVIQSVSKREASGGLIGTDVTALVLPSDPARAMDSSTYSEGLGRTAFLPALVDAQQGLVTWGEEMRATDAARTPSRLAVTPGRNERCWCGSGLKYKRCHGR